MTQPLATADGVALAAPLASAAVLINPLAGTTSGLDVAEVRARIEAAMPATALTFAIAEAGQLDAALEAAFDAAGDAVIVLGGDGTARAAAQRAMAGQMPIVPLPGGTMNVLAKLTMGHGDLDRAIDGLGAMRPIALDVGVVGGEPFFLSAAFGFAGPLARLREAMRPPRRWTAVRAAFSACAQGVGPSLRGGVSWRAAGLGGWRTAQTLAVAIGSVDRVLHAEDAPPELPRPILEAVALNLRSGWDIARLGAQATFRDWRSADAVERLRAPQLEINLRARRPLAVLDGEPMRLSHATEIVVRPRSLPTLAPV